MTDEKVNTAGLRPEVLANSSAWFASMQASLAEKDDLPLQILVWGPGKQTSNKHFEKRMVIVEHIKALSHRNDVVTSEMLDERFPEMVETWPDIFEREEVHARQADVIFMLLMSPHQTGVQSEITILKHDSRLVRKAHLYMPSDWVDSRSMLSQAVTNFPKHQITRLTVKQMNECRVIRSHSEKYLATVRAQKYLEKRRLEGLS